MGAIEVKAFLSYLTNERQVSISTHKRALCALLFLYKQVLGSEFPWMDDVYRPVVRLGFRQCARNGKSPLFWRRGRGRTR